MKVPYFAVVSPSHPSQVITDLLGIVAVCAFLAIACYIGAQVLGSSRRRPALKPGGELERFVHAGLKMEEHRPSVSEASARERLEAECAKRFDSIVEKGAPKLEELIGLAGRCFERIAESYAGNSYGHEGETRALREEKFGTVCERQWGFLRNEIAYLSYLDIQERLRHILDNHKMLDTHHGAAASEIVDLSPELLRLQEMVALMRVVSRDRVRSLQNDLLDAAREFAVAYDRGMKSWLNDCVVRLTKEIRRKPENGVGIADTSFHDRFKQLRTRLEIVARLSERVAENTQQIGESSLALSQVIYVGTVLRILVNLPEWLKEFDLASEAVEENEPVSHSA